MTGAGYHPGRQGNAYWRARAKVLAAATHCYLCGLELDFDAPPRSRWSPSVDHVVTLKQLRQFDPETRRKMATDPANMRPAHYGCNSRRGAQLQAARNRTAAELPPVKRWSRAW
jgi:5-methylcytosine-specific restriction endonuclease McrA